MSQSDYLKRQPELENKKKLDDVDDLLTVILAPIAERNFKRFQKEEQQFEGEEAEKFGERIQKFALFKERIPGKVISRDSHYSIEQLAMNVTDASIEHALNAYNAAQRKPLNPKTQLERMEEDGVLASIIEAHQCMGVFDHLVGKCGFEYIQGSASDNNTNGEIWLALGEPLGRNVDDDLFATCIVVMLSMQGKQ